MKRSATAVWNGTGKDGTGNLTSQSTVLQHTPYSFNSRFAQGAGTNPEELLAAAHAGCFSMKLAFILQQAGITPENITTTSLINFENGVITGSHLVVDVSAPGTTMELLDKSIEDARQNCPVSQALRIPITHEISSKIGG